MANRVLVNEDSLKDIAAAIKEKTGDFETSYTPGEMGPAIRNIEAGGAEPNLTELIVTDNGDYHAESDGFDGYSHVSVQVEGGSAELGETSLNANGEYYAIDEGYDGYHTVYVDVAPNLIDFTFTENGTYSAADEGYEGFGTIEVNVPSSGGGDLPEEAYNITGDCSYRFANGWDWFINNYGSNVKTKDMSGSSYMFMNSKVETIPFEMNYASYGYPIINGMFQYCEKLLEIPKFNGCIVCNMNYMFNGCFDLRYLPEDIEDYFDWSYMDSLTSAYNGGQRNNMFASCYSLRSIPMGFLNHGNPVVAYNYCIYSNGFTSCHALDEIVGLPIPCANSSWTGNGFASTFSQCNRLKELTFALQEDGTVYTCSGWKKQTIDLSNLVGYSTSQANILNYNSGITADKEVKDADTYAALKDDPDWFTTNVAYSRYNHDSAVNTINSLPDVSASGGVNTIQFKGEAGSATDGGAINTLTEAEIAEATVKGWTVSLV